MGSALAHIPRPAGGKFWLHKPRGGHFVLPRSTFVRGTFRLFRKTGLDMNGLGLAT